MMNISDGSQDNKKRPKNLQILKSRSYWLPTKTMQRTKWHYYASFPFNYNILKELNQDGSYLH